MIVFSIFDNVFLISFIQNIKICNIILCIFIIYFCILGSSLINSSFNCANYNFYSLWRHPIFVDQFLHVHGHDNLSRILVHFFQNFYEDIALQLYLKINYLNIFTKIVILVKIFSCSAGTPIEKYNLESLSN